MSMQENHGNLLIKWCAEGEWLEDNEPNATGWYWGIADEEDEDEFEGNTVGPFHSMLEAKNDASS